MVNIAIWKWSQSFVERAACQLVSSRTTVALGPMLVHGIRRLSSLSPQIPKGKDEDDAEQLLHLWKTINRAKSEEAPQPLPFLPQDVTKEYIKAEDIRYKNMAQLLNKVHPLEEQEDTEVAPTTLTFAGTAPMPITTKLHIVTSAEGAPRGIWPIFRLMDENGEFRDPEYDVKPTIRRLTSRFATTSDHDQPTAHDLELLTDHLCQQHPYLKTELKRSLLLQPARNNFPDIQTKNTLWRAYRQMVRLRKMDEVILSAQRQGRLSFYMGCRGEEAIHFGSASALSLDDVVFVQYREQGVFMWRGFTLDEFMNECFTNDLDLNKGKQNPICYGSHALNMVTVSPPLATQIPQAAGAGYRLKMEGKENVAVCFFGDGAASEGDFHAGLNFAATLRTPVVFICRNNGYAISTPVTDQYAGDGIVARAPGYGIAAIRVDGNDIFAVHAAVREAKTYAMENQAPVLIEVMTYRQSDHSTSDDSKCYRSEEEIREFADKFDPLLRFSKFLKRQGWLQSEEHESMIEREEETVVREAMLRADARPKPPPEEMFGDVYRVMPPHIAKQKDEFLAHIAKYPDKYKR